MIKILFLILQKQFNNKKRQNVLLKSNKSSKNILLATSFRKRIITTKHKTFMQQRVVKCPQQDSN